MPLLEKVRSIRFTLTLWYSAVLLAAIVLFGYGVFIYLQHLQESALEKDLVEEVDWIANLMDVERRSMPAGESFADLSLDLQQRLVGHFRTNPRNYIVLLSTEAGEILFQSPNSENHSMLGVEIPANRTIVASLPTPRGGFVRVAARRAFPFAIQVAYTEDITRGVLGHLLSIFSILAPVVLFLSIAGGWVLAGIVLQPIRQIASLANRITAKSLNERIPPRNVNDELGELIRTINSMIARLQESFQQIREFSMSVAHELKTPLTILKGESELALTREMTPEEAERLAVSYLEETARLSRIVDDLLTLAKAETGQLALERAPVAMGDLIVELYEDAQILSSDKDLRIVLGENPTAIVTGDALRLRQMLRAIVQNAVQYTDSGGRIRLSTRRIESDLLIDIEDNGMGIPPENIRRIFQRFFRAEEARARIKTGSGLGLAVARWIAESHGGSIDVVSTPGKGSCFTVRLPLGQSGA
jgi:two-component system, OmpR family, sensor kinase